MDSRLSQGYLCKMEHNKPGITLCANNFYSTSQQILLSADEMYMVQMCIVDILLLIYILFHCLHDSHLSFLNLSILFLPISLTFTESQFAFPLTTFFQDFFSLLFKFFSQLSLLQKTLCITLFISLFLYSFLLRYTQIFCSPLTTPAFPLYKRNITFCLFPLLFKYRSFNLSLSSSHSVCLYLFSTVLFVRHYLPIWLPMLSLKQSPDLHKNLRNSGRRRGKKIKNCSCHFDPTVKSRPRLIGRECNFGQNFRLLQ